MEKKAKKANLHMSLLMAVTLSFFLSLLGLVSAGQFNVPEFIKSFCISFVISLIIGFFVPMQRVGAAAAKALKLKRGSIGARLIESLISDLIYTPIITFCMVFMAYKAATAHGAPLKLAPMLIRSEIISILAAYVLIFIITPIYLKLVMKKNGLPFGKPDDGEDRH